MKRLITLTLAVVLAVFIAVGTKAKTNSNALDYCSAHPDEAPIAAHPECYCEADDETLPPGLGC